MPIDIAAGLGLAKNALDIIKAVREAAKKKKVTNEEFLDYLATLQDKLVDVKTALADADEQNRELRRQLDDREALRALKVDMEFQQDGGFYVRKSERDAGNPVAYCPVCWSEDKLNPLRFGANEGLFSCVIHKGAVYKTKVRIHADREAAQRSAGAPRPQSWLVR